MLTLRRRRTLFALGMSVPAMVFLAVFLVYPIGLVLLQSAYSYNLQAPAERVFVGLANYADVLGTDLFRQSATNTLVYTGVAVTVEFGFGLVLALLINSMTTGKQIVRTLFLLPVMLAPVIVAMLWRFVFADQYGFLNWVLYDVRLIPNPSHIRWLSDPDIALFSGVVADVWLTTPVMLLILLAGLQSLPHEPFEAARIDGASRWQLFWHITLPLLRPVIAVAVIIRIIDAARTFDLIWILTGGGPRFASELLSTQIYRTLLRFSDVGRSSAAAMIFMAALLVVAAIFFLFVWRPRRLQAY